jgi:NAD kinase
VPGYEKIIVVTKKTALEELVERFNTREQARFYLEHMGASFDEYQAAHDAYYASLERLKDSIPRGVRSQFIDRSFLPTFTFGEGDMVVTLGPDGLVVNTAKYLTSQPLAAFNPDRQRIDGVLIPFQIEMAPWVLQNAVRGGFSLNRISMARVELNDGQSLHAVNDFFIGQRTHVSARYSLRFGERVEDQSSSGIIVSTGAGSTGWFRSIITGAAEVIESFCGNAEVSAAKQQYRFDWEADYLYFSVREPFPSRVSGAELVLERIEAGQTLEVVSRMPQNGVIFSDGVEEDYLQFNSGAIARIGLAEKKLHLIVSA